MCQTNPETVLQIAARGMNDMCQTDPETVLHIAARRTNDMCQTDPETNASNSCTGHERHVPD
jgi:hypothetical protein